MREKRRKEEKEKKFKGLIEHYQVDQYMQYRSHREEREREGERTRKLIEISNGRKLPTSGRGRAHRSKEVPSRTPLTQGIKWLLQESDSFFIQKTLVWFD